MGLRVEGDRIVVEREVCVEVVRGHVFRVKGLWFRV
jgi:hypothetical protein